ncbi:DUF3800 domain-containing protein [Nocardioides dubius]|uniref:DUF3800 domain-containing protein n=1 Tax=Nocardioides dubius TaxID=317019 RepID=A0ABP4E939_9ACTN
MHLCYIDESGDAEALRVSIPNSTPVFVLVGLTVASSNVAELTWDFLQLKKELNPSLHRDSAMLSDLIEFEMKGSTLRKDFHRPTAGRNHRRRAHRVLDKIFALLEKHGCQLVGKIVVKVPDAPKPKTDRAVYSRAIAEMAETFQAQLAAADTPGMMILDARTKVKNVPSVMGITTRRYRTGGSAYPHLVESPVFGHSDTHVPLQIADILASAVLFPIACTEYCGDLGWNVHPHERYREIKDRYGVRLQQLEYRYTSAEGARRGGFQVIDPVGGRPTHLLFRD